MKLSYALAIGVVVAFAPGVAAAQQTGINNEVVCAGPGSGMDPRCIGETSPGTYSDFYGAPQYTFQYYGPIGRPVRRR